MHRLTLTTILLIVARVHSSLTTDYYENLINERLAKAKVYNLPTENEEFRAGAETKEIQDFGSYDFVIIGAGSAGNVLATRLSEVDDFKILLLEAGGEEDDFSNIPSMVRYLQASEMNWGYYSTPQKNSCLGMKDKKCMVPRGKAIGGTSAINGAMYVRGNHKDFDKWVEMGNLWWSYGKVQPYFKKSENSQIDGDYGYHRKGGLWNVEYSLPHSLQYGDFVKANLALNESIVDYNGRTQFGFGPVQFNSKRGRRQSTGTAFLENARKRKNLKVVTKALVTKINIDPKSKTAREVEFVTQNRKFRVSTAGEILLSAGAINSPQILMLSGVGPREHLEQLGIKVIADLPVGKNLIEHPSFAGLIFNTNYNDSTPSLKEMINQYLEGSGILTRYAGLEAVGFLQSHNKLKKVPPIEYLFIQPSGEAPWITQRSLNFDDELVNNYMSKVKPGAMVVYVILLHEKSRGQVTLKSTNPIDFPNIDLNMFEEKQDVDEMIEGIEYVLKLAETEAFKRIGAQLVDIPVCGEFTKYSKQFWECAVRQMTATMFHLCGTTPMGPYKQTSVVDSTLKVHGIKNLRVVDAGVIPTTMSAHTNAPTVMIAEKIADVIKLEHCFYRGILCKE